MSGRLLSSPSTAGGRPAVVDRPVHRVAPAASWYWGSFASRLTELSASPSGAPLTLAFRLVLDAQRRGEPVAWIGRKDAPFYPPDVADAGVDLAACAVVWAGDALAAAKAADLLVRSGAFGLVVLDLGRDARLPMHASSRLALLAKQHQAAVVCLTGGKEATRPSLGPLVSLRAHAASRVRGEGGRFRCEAVALKDKRAGKGWNIAEVCRGPDGLH
jgi:recombination protein RecA